MPHPRWSRISRSLRRGFRSPAQQASPRASHASVYGGSGCSWEAAHALSAEAHRPTRSAHWRGRRRPDTASRRTRCSGRPTSAGRHEHRGLAIAHHDDTIADAVTDWLTYGLSGRASATREKCAHLCRAHLLPDLGARKLRDLTAQDVDRWLADKAKILSTRSLRELYACLNRAIARAMARERVKRNVVALCTIPKGQPGRPSKSLTLEQAKALLDAAEGTRLHACVVLSLLTGARTEELRALTWAHVDLDGRPNHNPPLPPCIHVWRSVRAGGDTKTRKSRRTLALPQCCPPPAPPATRPRPCPSRQRLAPHRPRLHDLRRHRAGHGQRPTIIPPNRRQRRARPSRLDTPGTAPQLRLAALRQRRQPPGHR